MCLLTEQFSSYSSGLFSLLLQSCKVLAEQFLQSSIQNVDYVFLTASARYVCVIFINKLMVNFSLFVRQYVNYMWRYVFVSGSHAGSIRHPTRAAGGWRGPGGPGGSNGRRWQARCTNYTGPKQDPHRGQERHP